MKSSLLKTILLCAALALPVACDRTPEKSTEGKTKIGAIIPLTGEVATYGEALKRGFELAREHSGDGVSIIYEDSKADPKTGVTAFQKLTSRDNVEAILGDATSGVCLAIAPLAEQNHKVLLITIATSDKLAEAGEYVFRTAPPTRFKRIRRPISF